MFPEKSDAAGTDREALGAAGALFMLNNAGWY